MGYGLADVQKLAAPVVDVEAYKVKDLWIDLEVMSPVSTAGSYSITVTLYDGGEPVYAAGNLGAVRVQSAFKVWDLPQLKGLGFTISNSVAAPSRRVNNLPSAVTFCCSS